MLCATLVACKSHGNGAETTASPRNGIPAGGARAPWPAAGSAVAGGVAPVAAASGPTVAPEVRARQFLQHQIDSVAATPDLEATFTPDAIVLVHGHSSPASIVTMFGIGDGGPDGATTTKATITKLVAGGTADAVWFYADVTTEGHVPGGGGSNQSATRVVELIVASEKWRAVAASFGRGGKLQASDDNMEIPNATAADGPLAKLLGSTAAIGARLAPNAIAVGPTNEELASGAGAKAALAGWKLDPLMIYQRAREVHKPTWGFVQAYIDHPQPDSKYIDRLIGQAFAVPKPDGTWSVVLVQYRPD